ncbi:unnamed protein product, partial [Brenthis ino]
MQGRIPISWRLVGVAHLWLKLRPNLPLRSHLGPCTPLALENWVKQHAAEYRTGRGDFGVRGTALLQ